MAGEILYKSADKFIRVSSDLWYVIQHFSTIHVFICWQSSTNEVLNLSFFWSKDGIWKTEESGVINKVMNHFKFNHFDKILLFTRSEFLLYSFYYLGRNVLNSLIEKKIHFRIPTRIYFIWFHKRKLSKYIVYPLIESIWDK